MLFKRDIPLAERIFKGARYQLLALGRDEIIAFVPEVPYLEAATSPAKGFILYRSGV